MGNGVKKVKPKVKVIGVGGAGCNIIANSPYDSLAVCARRPNHHDRIVISRQLLELTMTSPPKTVISLGHEWSMRLRSETAEADLIYIFSGLGGELGSHLTPLVARICQRPDNLVVSSVALPFSVEGRDRREMAKMGLERVIGSSDLVITYPNDQLMKIAPHLPLGQAFSVMDSIMMVPPTELERVLTRDDLGHIRKDFADCSYLRFGYGTAVGHKRENIATFEAFTSPWFDFDMNNVCGGIVIISASNLDDVALREVTSRVSARLPNARVRLAAREDHSLGDKLKVILLLGVE